MKKFLFYSTIFPAVLVGVSTFLSCNKKKDPPPPPTATFVVTPAKTNFSSAAEQTSVKITSTVVTWAAIVIPKWITIDKASGVGDYNITMNIEKNPLIVSRKGNVYFKAAGFDDVLLTITQGPDTTFIAPTTTQRRVALLEELGGVRSTTYPDGHAIAKNILSVNPGKFITIATHANVYATPSTGWANYTTKAGTSIDSLIKPAGYPAGTMNRLPCSTLGTTALNGVPSSLAMGTNQWSTAAGTAISLFAPVNLGADATFNSTTRVLTVFVDMYYTNTETVQNNLNVSLLQDGLVSKQTGGTPDPNAYVQNNVLRDMITPGSWGEVITEAKTVGSKVRKVYYYTVPTEYNGTGADGGGTVDVSKLKVVAFVTRGKVEVLNAIQVAVK